MLTRVQDIASLFSILHDGRICHWDGTSERLQLRVFCDYLAQLINPAFEHFTVELDHVEQLAFRTWPNPFDGPVELLSTLDRVFRPELEILSTDVVGNAVEVTCNQHDLSYAYCGGVLSFVCAGVVVRDQGQQELSLEQLDALCQQYWNR